MDIDKTDGSEPDSVHEQTTGYFQTMLLATLILDQYERSVQVRSPRRFGLNSRLLLLF